jgi:hypothetical protein
MTIAPSKIASRKVIGMDIHHLREWAEFMDKAMIIALVIAALAAAAVGVTTWLSIKFNGAVRSEENATFDKYKVESDKRAAELEKEAALARERSAHLESGVADANERAAEANRESAKANERAATLEEAAAQAQERAAQLEKGVAEANARAAEAQLALAKFKAPRSLDPRQLAAMKVAVSAFSGTALDIFIAGTAPDLGSLAQTLSSNLKSSGWQPMVWTWSGIGPVAGAVILFEAGADSRTLAAADALVAALKDTDLPLTREPWPGPKWDEFGGMLNGPEFSAKRSQLRLVIGSKPQ